MFNLYLVVLLKLLLWYLESLLYLSKEGRSESLNITEWRPGHFTRFLSNDWNVAAAHLVQLLISICPCFLCGTTYHLHWLLYRFSCIFDYGCLDTLFEDFWGCLSDILSCSLQAWLDRLACLLECLLACFYSTPEHVVKFLVLLVVYHVDGVAAVELSIVLHNFFCCPHLLDNDCLSFYVIRPIVQKCLVQDLSSQLFPIVVSRQRLVPILR